MKIHLYKLIYARAYLHGIFDDDILLQLLLHNQLQILQTKYIFSFTTLLWDNLFVFDFYFGVF